MIVNKIKYTIKRFLYEFILLLTNIIAAYFAFIYISPVSQASIFWVSVSVFVLSLIVIIYLRTREKDFYYLPMDKSGSGDDWVGRGNFKFIRNEKCFEISNSHVGYIFPKTILWDDYKLQFQFKITHSCIAWILRASNLSNYLMFQCGLDGINPHIRVNGHWPIIQSHSDPNVNLSFDEPLSLDEWYSALIVCEKRSIRIKIYNSNKTYFDRYWETPEIIPVKLLSQDKQEIILNYDMDYDYGAIGFRDSNKEKALIKNIFVEKL